MHEGTCESVSSALLWHKTRYGDEAEEMNLSRVLDVISALYSRIFPCAHTHTFSRFPLRTSRRGLTKK